MTNHSIKSKLFTSNKGVITAADGYFTERPASYGNNEIELIGKRCNTSVKVLENIVERKSDFFCFSILLRPL